MKNDEIICKSCGVVFNIKDIKDKKHCPVCNYKLFDNYNNKYNVNSRNAMAIFLAILIIIIYSIVFTKKQIKHRTKNELIDKACELMTVEAKGGITYSGELILDFLLINNSNISIKDPVILCQFSGKSGGDTGAASEKIYQTVPQKETVRANNINFGKVNRQTTKINCQCIIGH